MSFFFFLLLLAVWTWYIVTIALSSIISAFRWLLLLFRHWPCERSLSWRCATIRSLSFPSRSSLLLQLVGPPWYLVPCWCLRWGSFRIADWRDYRNCKFWIRGIQFGSGIQKSKNCVESVWESVNNSLERGSVVDSFKIFLFHDLCEVHCFLTLEFHFLMSEQQVLMFSLERLVLLFDILHNWVSIPLTVF